MYEKHNSDADSAPRSQITLFGKRMKLMEPEAGPAPAARRSRVARAGEDAEERRVLWLAVGVFVAVFLAAFLGPRFFGSKDKVPVGPMRQPVEEIVVLQPEARQIPPQPADAPPADAPAEAAEKPADSLLEPPSADAASPARPGLARAQPASAPIRATPAIARPAERRGPGKTRAGRPPAREGAYIQRLREQMQRYDREKERGKYREFPQ